jgi:macrolide-specific efflux system membrane fusion protein
MGKVISLSPSAKKNVTSNGQETVIEAIISIDKSDVELKSGINVNCEIFTENKKGVLVADFDMMKEDKDGNKFVFVVDKDNIMRKKQIKLGVNTDMKAEVISGLNEGDMVVIKPLPSHKDGAKAKATKVVKSEEE